MLNASTQLFPSHEPHRPAPVCSHVRTLLQKHLPSELLLALLSSQQEEVVNLSLHVLQDLAHIVPAVIPVDAVPRLLQLLCCQTHGEDTSAVLA